MYFLLLFGKEDQLYNEIIKIKSISKTNRYKIWGTYGQFQKKIGNTTFPIPFKKEIVFDS
jgi:hypothetical protein